MGTAYTPVTIGSGITPQVTLNAEFAAIQTALGRLLNVYGDSTTGVNAMQVDLDMNSKHILNLPAPTNDSEPARLGDIPTSSVGATSAALTSVLDTAGNFTADNVEAILAEIVADLASTDTDDGTKGFHLVYYPLSSAEGAAAVTPSDYEYEWGDLRRFGVVGDGSAIDLTKISDAIAGIHTGGRVFGQADHIYNFGDIAGDAYAIEITKNITLDWQGAKLLCASNNDSAWTGTGLFKFTDCVCDMRDYVFEDTNFTFSGPSRGAKPITIRSEALSTQGHRIGPCRIIKGQSILTCGSSTPGTYIASDIQLVGPITGEQVYYGLNLAKNGDRVRGSFFIEEFNRLALIYDVDDIDVLMHGGGTANASSANLFVSNFGSRDTTNIKIKAIFDELNGLIRIADDFNTSGGAGIFRNINLDIEVKSYGSNLPSTSNEIVAIGTQAVSGFETSSTVTMDNITVDFKSETVPVNPIVKKTTSPNYGVFRFPSLHPNKSQTKEFTWQEGARFSKHITGATLSVAITGATQANPVVISAIAHGFVTSDVIPIYDVSGMTEINDIAHTITVIGADSFSLDGVNGTGYTAYTSGGTAHESVSMKLSDVITDEATAVWGLDVIINGAFDTAFSGQKTVIERQSVHGYMSSGGVITISGNNQVHQSKTGGDTPTIHFLANGADIVATIKGYTTTNGAIHFFVNQLR